MQLDVHISGLQEIKTSSQVEKEKDGEFKLISKISFEANIPPEVLLQLHRLTEIGAPLNCVISTDQSMFEFTEVEGKIKATMKAV